jgi:type IV secretory pathway VirJ component
MSLRRSARARLSASDPDVPGPVATSTASQSAEKRKRKRSTMTPETSQSPEKALSPPADQMLQQQQQLQQQTQSAAVSPLSEKVLPSRKIVVRNPYRDPGKTQSDVKDGLAPPESNGTLTAIDVEMEKYDESEEELQELYMDEDDKRKLETVLKA